MLCFRPGSNRRPCACEAHVITTTLRKLDVLTLGQFSFSLKGRGFFDLMFTKWIEPTVINYA